MGEGDVREGGAMRDGDAQPREGDPRDTGLRQRVREQHDLVQGALGVENISVDKKVCLCPFVRRARAHVRSRLDELGIDSLTAVDMGVELGRLFPDCKLPGDFLVRSTRPSRPSRPSSTPSSSRSRSVRPVLPPPRPCPHPHRRGRGHPTARCHPHVSPSRSGNERDISCHF